MQVLMRVNEILNWLTEPGSTETAIDRPVMCCSCGTIYPTKPNRCVACHSTRLMKAQLATLVYLRGALQWDGSVDFTKMAANLNENSEAVPGFKSSDELSTSLVTASEPQK